MAKITYNIRCKENNAVIVKSVTGQTFRVGGLRFGVSNENPDGSKSEVWKVTELSSGYMCTSSNTKRESINKVLDNNMLGKIKDFLAEAALDDINIGTATSAIYYLARGH